MTTKKASNTGYADPYLLLRKIFLHYVYYKPVKVLLIVMIFMYALVVTLEVTYILHHSNFDVITRYGSEITLMTYAIINLIVLLSVEKDVKRLIALFGSYWKAEEAGSEVQKLILSKSAFIRRFNYLVVACSILFGISLWPIWGPVDELFLFAHIFDSFGSWSKIVYYFFLISLPIGTATSISVCELLLIGILDFHIQLILLNYRIEQISADCGDNQDTIFDKLRLYVSYNVALSKWTNGLLELVKPRMPFFMIIGLLCTVAVLCFILYHFENSSNILKFRLFILITTNVLILYIFAEAGQLFSDETSLIFDTLALCPWYSWNKKNRQTLLIFMINTMEPLTFSLAGFSLDYRFALSIVQSSYSFATAFFSLRK